MARKTPLWTIAFTLAMGQAVKPETQEEYYSLRYSEFVVPLVKAVQELKIENDVLKKQNEFILKQNEALFLRVQALEAIKH